MRRLSLAALTVLQGAVACGTVWGFEDPIPVDALNRGGPDAGTTATDGEPPITIVDTPVAPDDPKRTCVPRPPDAWQGPLVIFEGTGAPLPTPPVCLEGYRAEPVYDGFGGFVAPDAACSCECAPPAGGSCSVKVSYFTDDACMTPCATPDRTFLSGAACPAAVNPCKYGKFDAVTMAPGSCTSSTKSKNKVPPAFTRISRVCAPVDTTQAGCPADRLATPTTSLPFNTSAYCIARTGEQACPATYPNRRLYFRNDAILDDRDCDCACPAVQGASCSGAPYSTDKTDCSGSKPWTKDCIEGKKYGDFTASEITIGSCAPEARVKGSATPTTPTTVCCTQ